MATEQTTVIYCDRCGKTIFSGPAEKSAAINRYSLTLCFDSGFTGACERETMDVCEKCYLN
jgi:hypothetical protein